MVAAFSGLHIGTSAIRAAQQGLNVTGQNIANSATPGYTRQRVDLESIGGPGVPAFWSKYDGTGEGVKVTGVTRMTDQFLVNRANKTYASVGDLSEVQKTLTAIERTVNEPSDTGLQKKLGEMWNAMGAAGNSPSVANQAPRAAALERAKEVAAQLNQMSNATSTQWHDTTVELQANVTDINKMASDIAKLNDAIRNNDIARVPSNELMDQRDLMIAKLSELTGATVRPAQMDQEAGFNSHAVDVMLDGKALVYGTQAASLKVVDPNGGTYPSKGDPRQPQLVGIQWESAASLDATPPTVGGPVDVSSGRVGGQLTSLNETIPKYMQQFDHVAAQLATTVNSQQQQGWLVTPDAAGKGVNGAPLFSGGAPITAENIRVVDGATADSIAVSAGNPYGAWGPKMDQPPSLDGNNALAMSRHINDKEGADASYNKLVVQLGVETQSVNRNVQVQENVMRQAEDARDNVSGVSLNEEMTNMIQFQHSFSAAAKFVATIDQTLDTLINMKR